MDKIPIRHINASSNELGLSEIFNIRNVSTLLAGADMVQQLHRHDFFYVLALNKGTGIHTIDFSPYKICDHSVFFMRPGQVHELVLKKRSTGYLMQFRNDYYFPHDKTSRSLLRRASNTNHYQPDANRLKKFLSVLNYIFQEYTDKNERYQEVIMANMDIFFIELIRQIDDITPANVNLYMQERLQEFLELLEIHVVNYKQVSHYAAILNLSSYQLNAVAKTMLGKTCSQVINEYIILEAKRYLLATSNQVNQIADHLGYEDISYFIRFFKKHTGYSPEVFRHNFK